MCLTEGDRRSTGAGALDLCRGSRPVQPLGASKGLLDHSHRGLHLSKELNFWSCKVSNLGLWSSVMKVIAWIKLSADELLVTSSEKGCVLCNGRKEEGKNMEHPF